MTQIFETDVLINIILMTGMSLGSPEKAWIAFWGRGSLLSDTAMSTNPEVLSRIVFEFLLFCSFIDSFLYILLGREV